MSSLCRYNFEAFKFGCRELKKIELKIRTCEMLAKDFHKLMKNIGSFSDSQATVSDYDDNLQTLKVEIIPNSGFYHGGKFDFEIEPNDYPNEAPSVKCSTVIYHPNIDSESGDICLNLFHEWTETNNLEDCVQGLLFLLYNPNLEDPLSPLFDPEQDNDLETFAERVKTSLEGGDVDGTFFERNLINEETVASENAMDCEDQTTESTRDIIVNKDGGTTDCTVTIFETNLVDEEAVEASENVVDCDDQTTESTRDIIVNKDSGTTELTDQGIVATKSEEIFRTARTVQELLNLVRYLAKVLHIKLQRNVRL